MKHLFVIRHGHYLETDLSELGREQIKKITEEMKSLIGEEYNGHYLLSSTAPRAEQTADIIAKSFGLKEFDKNSKLWTRKGYLSQEEFESIDGLIAPYKDNHDVVTISTHYEIVGLYPGHVTKTLFGSEESIGVIRKGEGVHINLEKKICQLIPRKPMFQY